MFFISLILYDNAFSLGSTMPVDYTYTSIHMKNKAKLIGGKLCVTIDDAAKVLELKTAEDDRWFATYYSPYDMDFAISAINTWAE